MTNSDLYSKNKYVKEVKRINFTKQSLIKGGHKNKYLIYIYSPDCEKCKQHYDLFIEFAILCPDYKMYAINCYDIKNLNDQLCIDLNITSYPTLLYHINNKLHKYKKQITYNNIEQLLFYN